jgi:hypothetical protein
VRLLAIGRLTQSGFTLCTDLADFQNSFEGLEIFKPAPVNFTFGQTGIFEPFYAPARSVPGVVSVTAHAIVSKSVGSLSGLLCPAYILRDTAACLGQTPDINPENRDPE